ncbi:calcium-binding protein [Parvularcula dongshanensis]|uniref:Ca2+-binding RTX toxin-like protein n=1 Tax=Parvularcula dongshanensis TaxID=1173995 RepID=A0A840I067_9PROT|nr:calcium-binding protein [Parvularcula dongshanensis]MBB4658466.1 Ca2+-binding RTX toxin-like protein [Parvularcula dongshanensis]
MTLRRGTSGDDTLLGTTGADTIYGESGDDHLDTGPSGSSYLWESDYLYGGSGNDSLFGRSNGARLYGENGNDTITAVGALAHLDGGSGNDTLHGSNSIVSVYDRFAGLARSETFDPGAGIDTIHTGDGLDRIELYSTSLSERIVYLEDFAPGDFLMLSAPIDDEQHKWITPVELHIDGDGNGTFETKVHFTDPIDPLTLVRSIDQLGGFTYLQLVGATQYDTIGDANDNLLVGGRYADRLSAGGGNDVVEGFAGDDTLVGGAGIDVILGGDGADLIYSEDPGVSASFSSGETLVGGAGDDTIYSVTSSEPDSKRNVIHDEAGDDLLIGSDGNEFWVLGPGSDTLSAGGGWDTLVVQTGYSGRHSVSLRGGVLRSDADANVVSGVNELNIDGGGDDDFISIYSDDLRSDAIDAMTLYGMAGNDFLEVVGKGSHELINTQGADTLLGGAGNTLVEATFADTLIVTGEGRDSITFRYLGDSDAGRTTIVDFTPDDQLILYLDRDRMSVESTSSETRLLLHDDSGGSQTIEIVLVGSYDGIFSLSQPDAVGQQLISYEGTVRARGFAGGSAADDLVGSAGNDSLWGFLGDDTITGGLGGDVIHGGDGNDVIWGDGA